MSWTKRPQGGAPPPAEQPRYTSPQVFGNQQNMYPNYHGVVSGNSQPQQFWQPPPQQPAYNQQYGQAYPQPGGNANQYYNQQPVQYNQSYASQNYGDNTRQTIQPGFYANQETQQQNFPQNKGTDGWDDNWDWGWEDAQKAQKSIGPSATSSQAIQPPQTQQVYSNANVIEESFATTDTWNWAMEDKRDGKNNLLAANKSNEQHATSDINSTLQMNSGNQLNTQNLSFNTSSQSITEEVRTLSDREVVKERMPNLALGKRFHLDNLTPQWSIESQMSQDSSDGPPTHSEGTFRSDMQSRNSDKSNCSQHSIDEPYAQNPDWSGYSAEEPPFLEKTLHKEKYEDITSTMQEMSIANSENPDTLNTDKELVSEHVQDNMTTQLEKSSSSSPSAFNQPSLAPSSSTSHIPPPQAPSMTVPPPPLSASMQPPNIPSSMTSLNPFKHAGSFSHKNTTKSASTNPSPGPSLSMSNTNLSSPTAVNKVSQHNRVPVSYGANLETTPDNSERPDQPQVLSYRPIQVTQVPENLEVAPKNDRNEYLQTAHLSSGNFGENTDFSRNIPPPGFRRMVVGQQESEYNQSINMSSEEPPPGLARMVPGQQQDGSENAYNQSTDNYLDRLIDGQPTDASGRPYRQADGQQTPDNFTQPPPPRNNERHVIGFDRMVPGEPSNNDYSQYQGSSYGGSNEARVVTGVDHDYPIPSDGGMSDVREQNFDGSDYSAHTPRNLPRNMIGVRESNDMPSEFNSVPEEQQREVVMEGENLQDLSIISSTELTFSREQTLDGADINTADTGNDRKTDASDSIEHPMTSSRRQSLSHINTSGDDSERDRAFKSSPRRDKHRSSRDRDRDEEGRYSRGDRKYDRDSERRAGRDDRWTEKDRRDRDREHERDRRERDDSPESRRRRRARPRYDTDDTDYCSDRERDRRRYREGSYSSKPPRPDDKERRYGDGRRHPTAERDRRDHDRDRRDHDRDRRYRDIDPARKHGSLRRDRDRDRDRDDEDRRRVVTFSADGAKAISSGRREGEREAGSPRAEQSRAERRRARGPRHYYAAEAYAADPFALQYSYYERLRRADPAAYLQLYRRLMAAQPTAAAAADYAKGFMPVGGEERGSEHSGRSSANGLKGHDTLYGYGGSMRGAASLRTDLSDRDLTTEADASLNLQLEESTVRSERMTPFKYATAHIKGSVGCRALALVRPVYPVDGQPARVQLVALAPLLAHARPAAARRLAALPGPLLHGLTHKKSVVEYCVARARRAAAEGAADPLGYALLWRLLALLLTQNGVVVGSDIAELLMKSTKEYEYHTPTKSSCDGSGGASPADGERPPAPEAAAPQPPPDEGAALLRLRELLLYGNRQEAIEWAMCAGLWGHALQLAADRRARAAVARRFVGSLPREDPLHTLYAHLLGEHAPALTCAAEAGWGDWRAHAAVLLANGARSDHDRRALLLLGDSLNSRGLVFAAQFMYVSAGEPVARHPLAPLQGSLGPQGAQQRAQPPRLTLLAADPRAPTLPLFATDEAILATEIYEYALSLSHDCVIDELQVYKLVMAVRLCDVGEFGRALAYCESAARAVARGASGASNERLARALVALGERLRGGEPVPAAVDGEPAPDAEPCWLEALRAALPAHAAAPTPHPTAAASPPPQPAADCTQLTADCTQPQYGWGEQTPQMYAVPAQTGYPEPLPEPIPSEETPDYGALYYQHQQQLEQQQQQQLEQQPPPPPEQPDSYETTDSYSQPISYWQPDISYGYGEGGAPRITMPGGGRGALPAADGGPPAAGDRPPSAQQPERETARDSPKAGSNRTEGKQKEESAGAGKESKGGGWLGGILTKLSLRPPNQMILPDDKNPSIVWDEQSKRWRNRDADEDEAPAPPPPPPLHNGSVRRRSGSPPLAGAPPPSAPPPTAPQANIFKMQKSRHIKKSYVDVLNPGGAGRSPHAPPAAPPAAPYLVPAQPHQGGIYDPTQMAADEDNYHNSGI